MYELNPEKRHHVVLEAQRFSKEEPGPVSSTRTPADWIAYWERVHGLEGNAKKGSWACLGIDLWTTR